MATKGKILYTATSAGHVRRYHVPIIRMLSDMGFAITLAIGEGDVSGLDLPVEETVINMGLCSEMTPANRNEMKVLLQRGAFDIVSSVDHWGHRSAGFVRRSLRASGCKPKVNAVLSFGFGFDDDTNPIKRRVRMHSDRVLRKSTDLMMVMNTGDYRIASERGLARLVRLVPGTGADIASLKELSAQPRAEVRASLGCSDDDFVVLYAGEFDKNHHQRFLVENMLYINRDVKLFLLGKGAQMAKCQDRVHCLGLEGNVIMPGVVDDVTPYLQAADVTLSACRYEGLPKFIVEAQAMGKPSIVSAVKGNLDVVTNGVNGLTFRLGDRDSFIDALHTLQFDARRRARFAAAAPASVAGYDEKIALDAIAACYEEALALGSQR